MYNTDLTEPTEPALAATSGREKLPWIAHQTRAWYVLCLSDELTTKPIARKLFGQPIVLFRAADGRVGALLDRCPHRSVPLSLGRVKGQQIECEYHGWQFDARGNRVRVPGLIGHPEAKSCMVPSFATREHDGLVWVYGTADVDPADEPFRVPDKQAEGYTTVLRWYDIESSLFASVENALDVPHSAFLHRGLFRGAGEPQTIKTVITRYTDRIEVDYIGERPPQGLASRLLTSSREVMTHTDRFILPSITQVEYRLGSKGHLTTFYCTPVEDYSTRVFGAFQFRLGLPGWLLTRVMSPLIRRIILQDVNMLKAQSATIRQFREELYISTELDLLGLQIWQLMRSAASGAVNRDGATNETAAPWRRELEMRI